MLIEKSACESARIVCGERVQDKVAEGRTRQDMALTRSALGTHGKLSSEGQSSKRLEVNLVCNHASFARQCLRQCLKSTKHRFSGN
jgi:hypothetical protein